MMAPRMQRGFSLMELVLVVAVLGILVALYINSTGDLSDVAIDAASRKVQSDLRYAHQLAVSSGVRHGALFTASGGYQVYEGSPGNYVMDPVTRGDMVMNLSDFEGIAIAADYQVEFDGSGTPLMGGDSYVRLVAGSGAIRDVYVIDKTGAVVIDLIEYGQGCQCTLCR